MSEQTYVKGDRTRVVTTPSERVAAEFEGFRLAETKQEEAEQPNDQASSTVTDEDSSDAPAGYRPFGQTENDFA